MQLRIHVVVATLAFFVAAAAPVRGDAAIVSGSFSGTIFAGTDVGGGPSGFFGAGVDLTDLPITGTFRYDTSEVPSASATGPNSATYSDLTFSTDFLEFTVTINGQTYGFGDFTGPPGIQSIDVIDNTDQLQFDYQRFSTSASESLSLRFISDIDFLTGTGVPTQFTFTASGIGLTPGGSFSFDRSSGAFASASFTIERGVAVVQQVPEPSSIAIVAAGLLALAAVRRRAGAA